MEENKPSVAHHSFTIQILIGMLLGVVVGLAIKWLPLSANFRELLVVDVLKTVGNIFLNVIKMLVVPIVLVSIVCGVSHLDSGRKLGRIGGKTFLFYVLTTAIAISVALIIASMFNIGHGIHLTAPANFVRPKIVSLTEIIVNLIPSNPFKALAEGNMLQVIIFAILLGSAIAACGQVGKKVATFFDLLNEVLMKLIVMVLRITPLGVFCLLAVLFAQNGLSVIKGLAGYFAIVLLVLLVQLLLVYSVLLRTFGKISPWWFFKNMRTAMLFAFSVSSSNASIPLVLRTVEEKLGVNNSVAAFVIPLGATINMDGTAIMQGVATVFIAHAYHISLSITGYLTVIGMATLASIGTAGVPSVGLITLAMVLEQVGLPVQGIALIIGVDRLLDMARTAVNIAGDAMVACLVNNSEGK